LNSLGKRERRHKRIWAVSPSILLAKGEEKEVNEERRRVAQVFGQ